RAHGLQRRRRQKKSPDETVRGFRNVTERELLLLAARRVASRGLALLGLLLLALLLFLGAGVSTLIAASGVALGVSRSAESEQPKRAKQPQQILLHLMFSL